MQLICLSINSEAMIEMCKRMANYTLSEHMSNQIVVHAQ